MANSMMRSKLSALAPVVEGEMEEPLEAFDEEEPSSPAGGGEEYSASDGSMTPISGGTPNPPSGGYHGESRFAVTTSPP